LRCGKQRNGVAGCAFPPSTINRTELGANYNIAVSEILDAHTAGRLDEWVVEAAYRYANRVSEILGVDPPATLES